MREDGGAESAREEMREEMREEKKGSGERWREEQ